MAKQAAKKSNLDAAIDEATYNYRIQRQALVEAAVEALRRLGAPEDPKALFADAQKDLASIKDPLDCDTATERAIVRAIARLSLLLEDEESGGVSPNLFCPEFSAAMRKTG